jgi:hypothetical protein
MLPLLEVEQNLTWGKCPTVIPTVPPLNLLRYNSGDENQTEGKGADVRRPGRELLQRGQGRAQGYCD